MTASPGDPRAVAAESFLDSATEEEFLGAIDIVDLDRVRRRPLAEEEL